MKLYFLAIVLFGVHTTGAVSVRDEIDQLKDEVRSLKQQIVAPKEAASLRDEFNQMKDEIRILKQQIVTPKAVTPSCAFSARISETANVNDDVIPFGILDLNIGGAYDPFVGVFTVPVAGTYTFTVYAMSLSDDAEVQIKVNGVQRCLTYAWQSEVGLSPGVCTIIAQLSPGDAVTVNGNDENPGNLLVGYSGFTGHIINQ